jgi:hypothetical protein
MRASNRDGFDMVYSYQLFSGTTNSNTPAMVAHAPAQTAMFTDSFGAVFRPGNFSYVQAER